MDVLLANPRGFCAGVDRAIEIVKRAIDSLGAPIYVRHEVVHNKFVVDSLRAQGAPAAAKVQEDPLTAQYNKTMGEIDKKQFEQYDALLKRAGTVKTDNSPIRLNNEVVSSGGRLSLFRYPEDKALPEGGGERRQRTTQNGKK